MYNTMQRTEPMTIGSPTSPGGRQHSPFLPAFLMGDTSYSAPHTPNSKAWGVHSSPGCASLNRSSANHNATGFLNSSRNDLVTKDDPAKCPGRMRNGGPPVKGLFESLPPTCGTLPFKLDNNDSQLASTGRSHPFASALNDSQLLNPMLPYCDGKPTDSRRRLSQLTSPHDSHSFQGESPLSEESVDETWVTIFGFPTTTESFILQEFSSVGTIVKHLVPPEGNWMHVQFQNQLQARRALSRHCKVLQGNVMIGVKPCCDKAVLESNKENSGLAMKPTCMNSPARTVLPPGSQDSHQRPVRGSSIRCLASGTQAQSSPAELKRKSSIISKAMGYVFG